jgi:hypothetical protein
MEIKDTTGTQLELCATFKPGMWRWWLMQFTALVTGLFDSHRSPPWLEEDGVIIQRGPIYNVFKIQAGDSRDKQAAIGRHMLQAPDSVVAGTLSVGT